VHEVCCHTAICNVTNIGAECTLIMSVLKYSPHWHVLHFNSMQCIELLICGLGRKCPWVVNMFLIVFLLHNSGQWIPLKDYNCTKLTTVCIPLLCSHDNQHNQLFTTAQSIFYFFLVMGYGLDFYVKCHN